MILPIVASALFMTKSFLLGNQAEKIIFESWEEKSKCENEELVIINNSGRHPFCVLRPAHRIIKVAHIAVRKTQNAVRISQIRRLQFSACRSKKLCCFALI